VARAIVEAARARGVALPALEAFEPTHGLGVEGRVEGHVVRLGNAEWLRDAGVSLDGAPTVADGETPVLVAVDGALAGVIAVADTLSPEALPALEALRALGVELVIVSGDREETVASVARQAGITKYFAGVKPAAKARVARTQSARGHVVAMVGDGVNDAPALAAADVGIAVGEGAEVAVATADIALLRGGLGQLPRALELARRALRTIKENLFWAFAYNVLGIPLAAGVLHGVGVTLSPVFASAAMSLSSVSVLLNSLRLRRFGKV
jgi:Cu+-exporting ATPase